MLQGYRVPCARHDVPVSRSPARFTSSPSPALLRARVHPLVSFAPLQSTYRSNLPRTHVRSAFPGVSFLFATSARESTCRASFPRLALRSVLSVSHALDGLLLSSPCGFVSPRSHVQDSPFRGLIPSLSRSASSATRTLLTLRGSLLPSSCPEDAVVCRPVYRVFIQASVRDHRQAV